MNFKTIQVPINYDELAPDGSEIRLLPNLKGGGMCHYTLPAGKTSRAVMHKNVNEIQHFLKANAKKKRGKAWLHEHYKNMEI